MADEVLQLPKAKIVTAVDLLEPVVDLALLNTVVSLMGMSPEDIESKARLGGLVEVIRHFNTYGRVGEFIDTLAQRNPAARGAVGAVKRMLACSLPSRVADPPSSYLHFLDRTEVVDNLEDALRAPPADGPRRSLAVVLISARESDDANYLKRRLAISLAELNGAPDQGNDRIPAMALPGFTDPNFERNAAKAFLKALVPDRTWQMPAAPPLLRPVVDHLRTTNARRAAWLELNIEHAPYGRKAIEALAANWPAADLEDMRFDGHVTLFVILSTTGPDRLAWDCPRCRAFAADLEPALRPNAYLMVLNMGGLRNCLIGDADVWLDTLRDKSIDFPQRFEDDLRGALAEHGRAGGDQSFTFRQARIAVSAIEREV